VAVSRHDATPFNSGNSYTTSADVAAAAQETADPALLGRLTEQDC
jgi:hypothetical protein